MTLHDYLTGRGLSAGLFDAPTGTPVADDARAYEVLALILDGGYTWLAVRGPSGRADVADLADGCRLHRDALRGGSALELAAWVSLHCPA
jgi:hypothetical protein